MKNAEVIQNRFIFVVVERKFTIAVKVNFFNYISLLYVKWAYKVICKHNKQRTHQITIQEELLLTGFEHPSVWEIANVSWPGFYILKDSRAKSTRRRLPL